MKYTFVGAAIAACSLAGDSAAWKQRSVYQILTDRFATSNGTTTACTKLSNYCGGTFDGIQKNLSYIKGMGFDAIWISPVVDNYPQGYHGYWA
jgi:alpha-amylase